MAKFVIGIGSQRAGSTLLHRILDECSPIYMNPVKELHYFDTLFNVRHPSTLRHFSHHQLNNRINQIVKSNDFNFIDKRYKNELRTNFILATKKVENIEYIDLFRPCVLGNEYLGEITPEYMILPQEGIIKMREVLGDTAKIILIARNPVKRFVSAFKLLMYGIPNSNELVFEQEMLNVLVNGGEWLRVQDAFNDYETAFNQYQEAFPNMLMISYDELFGKPECSVEKLSQFIGVSISLSKYQKLVETKINTLTETSELSRETILLLENRYAGNQAYLDRMFGDNICLN